MLDKTDERNQDKEKEASEVPGAEALHDHSKMGARSIIEGTLSYLSDLVGGGTTGNICVKINSITTSLRSRSGWQYRRLGVEDRSMKADILISEAKFSQWEIHTGDCITARAKSNGVDNEGKLSFFFDDFLGPFDSSEILYSLNSKLYETKARSGERMKSNETVYQISAREAKSLLELIKLWISEGKAQHYTKWCQMHQIVATNLYYMGLVKRTASMSGHYYPTDVALEFFEGKRGFPKKKVFIRGKDGKHEEIGEEGEVKSFEAYLYDYADRESALKEYKEALESYKNTLKSKPEFANRANQA